jgi:hypothetical protein
MAPAASTRVSRTCPRQLARRDLVQNEREKQVEEPEFAGRHELGL